MYGDIVLSNVLVVHNEQLHARLFDSIDILLCRMFEILSFE